MSQHHALLLPAIASALLLLACAGGDAPEAPADPPAPVAAEVVEAPAVEKAPTGHCVEATRFSCEVAGGKQLALCEEEGALVYRFGKLGALEKEYPGAGVSPEWTLREITTVSAAGHGLSFKGASHSFEVSEMAGAGGPNAEANNFAGVVVSKGEDTVSTIPCTGPVESDWARIAQLVPQQ